MQRAVITDLNGAKMETSSGHTLTCQPHFPLVDMRAAVPSLLPSPLTPSLFPHLCPYSSSVSLSILALPGQVWHTETSSSPPAAHTHRRTQTHLHTHIHTLCPLSAAPKADLLFKLMARYVKQT